MSLSRVFSVIGDSNIQRHVTKNSCRANPAVKASQMLSCGHVGIFGAALEKVRSQSNVIIVACISSFLASADGPVSVAHRVAPVLEAFLSDLVVACAARPGQSFMIAPPMYRTHPVWYREGLPEIMSMFS